MKKKDYLIKNWIEDWKNKIPEHCINQVMLALKNEIRASSGSSGK